MHRFKWPLILFIFVVAVLSVPATAKKDDIEAEKKLGQQAAIETDKTLKFIKDEKYTKRVNEIGQKIAAIAGKVKVPATYGSDELTDFTYTFKVVDDKEINAESLPAGYIYINKGLLDHVESDDELAGVIAHEAAHVAHHHMVQLLKKQGQYNAYVLALLAATVIGKADSGDLQNVYYGAKMFEIAKLNGYSREAEEDADKTAIEYMTRAGYNPVGMLTFIEKLARDDAYNPVDYGVYMNHPYSKDRADYLIAELNKRHIPINRRAVTSDMMAVVKDITVGEKNISQVVVDDRVIFKAADTESLSSSDRAKSIAAILNKAFDMNPDIRDVKIGNEDTGVYIKDKLIVDVLPEDAALASTTREALAASVHEAIQAVLVSESLKLMY
ncbi:MAG: M48 family metalloprotease [Armatimonadota bacterium]